MTLRLWILRPFARIYPIYDDSTPDRFAANVNRNKDGERLIEGFKYRPMTFQCLIIVCCRSGGNVQSWKINV